MITNGLHTLELGPSNWRGEWIRISPVTLRKHEDTLFNELVLSGETQEFFRFITTEPGSWGKDDEEDISWKGTKRSCYGRLHAFHVWSHKYLIQATYEATYK